MKYTTVRNLFFAGTMAGVIIGSSGSVKYLEHRVEESKSSPVVRLEEIDEQINGPISLYRTQQLLAERIEILSNPNFEKIKSDYDSKNKDAAWGALYIILGGAAMSLGSLGSFMVYRRRTLKNNL